MRELRIIREELQYIREHMVDVDMLLTPEGSGIDQLPFYPVFTIKLK